MQNSSSELILANFYIKLTNNLPIDDYLLKSFIQECVFGETEEEKFFKSIIATISRKEHMQPTLVEEWCLPDIVLLFSKYLEEIDQIKEIGDEIERATAK